MRRKAYLFSLYERYQSPNYIIKIGQAIHILEFYILSIFFVFFIKIFFLSAFFLSIIICVRWWAVCIFVEHTNDFELAVVVLIRSYVYCRTVFFLLRKINAHF